MRFTEEHVALPKVVHRVAAGDIAPEGEVAA